jgi:hypothetical protein
VLVSVEDALDLGSGMNMAEAGGESIGNLPESAPRIEESPVQMLAMPEAEKIAKRRFYVEPL